MSYFRMTIIESHLSLNLYIIKIIMTSDIDQCGENSLLRLN